ncbi:putative DNA binding domain-containing protein [Paenibacillus alginolyticus]|uniref:AlbA family DNA-binding domain-containing protein n=1 Tax=Paenibacillus alginolyticus TaxID=59839 RepID=UPI000427917F|nr:RNA-binding domain-containing protein [Paenibacillus alginolyticus]MCY9669773.1 putative DNA binding domain-containing protein [Paenibacillus alginolyticus]
MITSRSEDYLRSLINELRAIANETEWVEFKHNNKDPKVIGEYISALSNGAALHGKSHGYMVWGLDDESHEIVGTSFEPKNAKIGNEELENWLLKLLNPRIMFVFHEVSTDYGKVVMLEIERAAGSPVQFQGVEYIRIGSYKKSLKEHPARERDLWRVFDHVPFEDRVAAEHVPESDVLKLLDYPSYFELLDVALPEDRKRILERLSQDSMISRCDAGGWNITNLGAILFAKKLSNFKHLSRKSVRVIVYSGKDRIETQREQEGAKGYASGFEGLIGFIDNLLPRNEVIGKALRKDVPMYPELAVRELVANAIIHQDFSMRGTGPMIEVF